MYTWDVPDGMLVLGVTHAAARFRRWSTMMAEYLRPWKLVTLAIGVALLVLGAIYEQAIDWDIPISLIMAALAYLTAPWSMRVLLDRRWRQWPLMLVTVWFSVDGCYWMYWQFKNPAVLETMRSANFPASLSLYALCGAIWVYRGSLRELSADLRSALHPSGRKQP